MSFSSISSELEQQFPATTIVRIDPNNIDQHLLEQHVLPLISEGEPIAIPTETVYGLAADALNTNAVEKIFKAKGRPSDNPLIVHISNIEQLKHLIDPESFPQPGSLTRRLCDHFWPGPLTILFKKNSNLPNNVTAGKNFVGIRMPAHPIASTLIELSGKPLAAPSANRSGRPSPTKALHVLQDLGRVNEINENQSTEFSFGCGTGVKCIVDGGECTVGVESTVVSIDQMQILRPGGVTLEQLQEFDSRFTLFPSLIFNGDISSLSNDEKELLEKPSTPGLKYTHYSPIAPLTVCEFNNQWQEYQKSIDSFITSHLENQPNLLIGVLHIHNQLRYDHFPSKNLIIHQIGSTNQLSEVARNLFAGFRLLDQAGANIILMEGVQEQHEGLAIMNRARKAAAITIQ